MFNSNCKKIFLATLAVGVLLSPQVWAEKNVKKSAKKSTPKSAKQILASVDHALAPDMATMKTELTTLRRDGTKKIYRMTIYKRGDDLTRVEFSYPPIERGRKILMNGKDMWMIMRNLKKPIRTSFKDSFMGGDFNNNDVIRLNLSRDYTPTIKETKGGLWTLELKAKDRAVSYHRVLLWVSQKNNLPTKAHYFTLSGKLLKELRFKDVKDYSGHRRPATLIMKNMISKKSESTLTISDMTAGKTLSAAMFRRNALTR